jgi:Ribbon-helix-helix protein, copG family
MSGRGTAGNLVLTNIYLEQAQKKAIARKAKANGTNVSVEIRHAVDAYLAGLGTEELGLLDAATRQAKIEIDQMNAILDGGQVRARKFFSDLEEIKAQASE